MVLEEDVLPEQVLDVARQLAAAHGARVEKVWSHAVKAFFAVMPEGRAAALSRNPKVKYVEENAPWYLSATHQTNINPITCDPTAGTCTTTVPDNRLWHLDRGDQNYATPNSSYSYCTDGSGVTVYVVDTGVNRNHQEFAPSGFRVQSGFNSTSDLMPADDPCMGFALPATFFFEQSLFQAEVFLSGHGTSVASALGGKRVGVAKNVTIVPVKVARCDQWSGRERISAHFYQQNETMYRSPNSGTSAGELYRALNSGFSAGTDPGGWPIAPNATKVDGQITWLVVPPTEYENKSSTTQNLIDGLNWILSPSNTGPKSHAVVTLSTYRVATAPDVAGAGNTVEQAIRNLLANNITVVASANNQNGNACDTSPGRMSLNNPDPSVANNVITAGGSMLLNRPWTVNLQDVPGAVEADGPRLPPFSPWGVEPAYDQTKGVCDARWICGPGDSSNVCSNTTATESGNPGHTTYTGFQGGSNAGPCVTLFVPAKNQFLARTDAANAYRDNRVRGGRASGTSWSAPIVAGFAARVLQSNPTFTPVQVRTTLLANTLPILDPATLNSFDHDSNLITGTPNALLRLGDVNITDHPDSTAAAVSGPTALTMAASGTSSPTIQWYEVNSDFDYATYKRGAFSSTPIAGATSTTFQAPASAVRRAYWARATNSCGTADTDIAVVVPRPGAPSNVIATASGTSVTVTWSAVTGAEKYEIQRKVSGQAWTRAGVVDAPSTNFSETPSAPGGMVVYRVLSAAGVQYLQDPN